MAGAVLRCAVMLTCLAFVYFPDIFMLGWHESNKLVLCVAVLPKAGGSLCSLLIFPDSHHGVSRDRSWV